MRKGLTPTQLCVCLEVSMIWGGPLTPGGCYTGAGRHLRSGSGGTQPQGAGSLQLGLPLLPIDTLLRLQLLRLQLNVAECTWD